MTERTIATITVDDTRGALFGWDLGNQIDGPILVNVSLCIHKTSIAIIVLFKDLIKKRNSSQRRGW